MSTRQLIAREARKRGLDPRAVLAVASVEGGFNGAIGDGGTSFGSFQLHRGGALPRGIRNPQQWANSPQGISYALDQIAHVARGKHGRDAIAAIVSRFERPAAPGAEIAKASSRYGQVGGAPQMGPGPRAAAPNGAPNALSLMQALGGQQTDVRSLIPLLQQTQAQPKKPRVRKQPAQATSEHSVGASINELFYDPIGGVKYGKQIGAIGGHGDHVHVSLSSEGAQKVAIARARAMGLHVGEESNKDVHPVHAEHSFHYRHYRKGDPLREAADVSGDPKRMAAYYRWIEARFG